MAHANTLVSIIVPVFNVKPYLVRCVDSLLAQTYSNLEIILVDDGSTDGSGRICDLYANSDPRVRVIHKGNGGVSSARNKGIEVCKGQFVSFVDSDDWVASDFIGVLMSNLATFDADISSCGIQRVSGERDSNVVQSRRAPGPSVMGNVEATKGAIMDTWLFFSVCNRLYKRSLIDATRFSTRMTFAEDQYFNFCTYFRARYSVHDPVARYFYAYRPTSSIATRDRLNEDRLYMIKKMREIVTDAEGGQDLRRIVDAREVMDYIQLLVEIARRPGLDRSGAKQHAYFENLRTLALGNLDNSALGWKFRLSLLLALTNGHFLSAFLILYVRLERVGDWVRRKAQLEESGG